MLACHILILIGSHWRHTCDGLNLMAFSGINTMKSRSIPPHNHPGQPGEDDYFHAMFADLEADQLVASWEIISKEKR